MIGTYAIGANPLGAIEDDLFTPSVVDLRYSTGGYISDTTDTPASQWFDERVTQPLAFARSILGARFGGLAQEQAEIRISNTDGALDAFPSSYAIDYRAVRVQVGEPDFPLGDFGTIFQGVMVSAELTEDELLLAVRTKRYALEVPIQIRTYAGTGGTEGGDDLAGRIKPLCYGCCYNVPALLVDAVNLIYQVHDGLIEDITAVYDRGVELTKVAGVPAAGEWSVDTLNGRFTLGSTPAGTVTADVRGRHNGTAWLTTLADIVSDIATNAGGLVPGDLDAASFTALNTAQPGQIGIFLAEPATCAEVIDELLGGVGCFGFFSLQSKLTVGQIALAGAAPQFELTDDEIVSATRQALPDGLSPLAWRWRVAYQRSWLVQTDLAAAATAARRAFVAVQYRIASDMNTGLLSTYPLATDPEPQISPLQLKADAEAEAERQFAIFGQRRWLYVLRIKPALWTADIGQTVQITYPRHGLNSGVLGVVLGIDLDAQANESELVVLA